MQPPHSETVRHKNEMPLLGIVDRTVGAAVSGDSGDHSHWWLFPHLVCKEPSKWSLTLVCA